MVVPVRMLPYPRVFESLHGITLGLSKYKFLDSFSVHLVELLRRFRQRYVVAKASCSGPPRIESHLDVFDFWRICIINVGPQPE